MGVLAVTGAKCMCSFGSSTCPLAVTSQLTSMAEGKPIATIRDMQPGTNLVTFGMCSSLANPAVAAATAAALGVLTPQPCTMVPAGTWIPAQPKVMVSGIPCLTNEATLMCGLGAGTVRIVDPGQKKVLV